MPSGRAILDFIWGMSAYAIRAFVMIVWGLALCGPVHASSLDALAGTWRGTLTVPGASIPLVLRIDISLDGISAALDSPSQGATGMEVDALSREGDTVRFKVPSIGGAFEGTLSSPNEIEGEWRQGAGRFPLTFQKADEDASTAQRGPTDQPRRPQERAPDGTFTEEEISFASLVQSPRSQMPRAQTPKAQTSKARTTGDPIDVDEAGFRLVGTLTKPTDAPTCPQAVVLVSGSGAQDRDMSVVGHRPFLVLARHLARHGISSLRYDERGVGASGGTFETATTANFAEDAAAATRALSLVMGLGQEHVSVLGISEGGIAALMAGSFGVDFDRAVLLSTPMVPYSEAVVDQVRALSVAAGEPPAVTEAKVTAQRRIIAAALAAGDEPAVIEEAVLRELMVLGVPEATARAQAAPFGTPWLAAFLRLDPRPLLANRQGQVLALWGSKDVQVPAQKSLEIFQSIMPADQFDAAILDGLNHLLQPAETGLVSEYAQIETTMDEEALERITKWLLETSSPC